MRIRSINVSNKILLIVVPVILLSTIYACSSRNSFQYSFHKIKALERRYGFTYATTVYRHTPCYIELITLMSVTPGGAFDKAGFKPGDVFDHALFPSSDAFFAKLDKPSGTRIEFEVLPGDRFEPTCDFESSGKTVLRKIIAP